MSNITKREATTYIIAVSCGVCGEELTPTGEVLMTNPPQYTHSCVNGHKDIFRERYPKVDYEFKEGTEGKETEPVFLSE